MKGEELRLGNLVSNMNPRHNDSILTIESIGDNHEVNVFYRKYLLSELEPIPLTEEWLLKLGFKNNSMNTYNILLQGFLLEYNLQHNVVDAVNKVHFNLNIPVKYVHQLQNLYFALTGEELTKQQEQ
jgi:hypothetical protein